MGEEQVVDAPAAPAARPALHEALRPAPDGATTQERLLWLCARVSSSARDLEALSGLATTLDAHGWELLVARAQANGVGNLLFKNAASAGLLSHIPAKTLARMRAHYGEVAIATRRLEREFTRVASLLQDAGAPVILLKGLTLARRLYGNIALRPISDIDLLVHAEDGAMVVAALEKAGFSAVAGKSDPLSKHVLRFREMQFHNAREQVIEIHVSLCRYPAYRRAFMAEAIWARARPLDDAGGWARVLAPHDELLFLCLHYAVQHRIGRLIWLTDITEIARRMAGEEAWDALVEDVVARGVAAPVAVTLAHAGALLDAPVPEPALERLRAAALTDAERRAWESATREMSGLRWYLSQMTVVRTSLERASLLAQGCAAFVGRVRRRARR